MKLYNGSEKVMVSGQLNAHKYLKGESYHAFAYMLKSLMIEPYFLS